MSTSAPSRSDRSKLRHPWLAVGVVFALALTVRLVYLWQDAASPFFACRGIDAKQYHEMALGLLNGTWPDRQAFFWPPLYSLFLGSIYTLFGPGVAAVKIVQALLGALGCVMVLGIARRTIGGRVVPIAAALACCLNGAMVYFDGQLLSASLDTVLLLAAVWLALIAAQRRHVAWWLATGLALGLSAINRGAILLLLPFVLFWIYAVTRRAWPTAPDAPASTDAPGATAGLPASVRKTPQPHAKTSWLAPAVATLIPIVLLVLPVAWHNARYDDPADTSTAAAAKRLITGQSSLIATNGGINLYLGNHWDLRLINDTEHPLHFKYYDAIRAEPADQGLTSAAAQSRYLTRQTLADIAAKPGDWLKLMATKLGQLVNGREIPRNANPYADRQHSSLLAALLWTHGLALPAGLVIPLGIAGIILARHTWRQHVLLLAAILVQAVFVLAFFVTARYRVPVMPLLTIYAALAVVTFVNHIRARSVRQVVPTLIVMHLLLIASNVHAGRMDTRHGAQEHYNLGVQFTEQGNYDQAMTHFRQALDVNPDFVKAHNNLAGALSTTGRPRDAINHYQHALRIDPDYPDAHYNLANLFVMTGQPAAAIVHYRAMLRLDPDHTNTLNNLAWLLATAADPARRDGLQAVALAERLCRQANQPDPGHLDTLAAAYAQASQFDRAIATAQQAIDLARQTNQPDLAKDITTRLEIYRQHRPYHIAPPRQP